jgi:hypothetical protein
MHTCAGKLANVVGKFVQDQPKPSLQTYYKKKRSDEKQVL